MSVDSKKFESWYDMHAQSMMQKFIQDNQLSKEQLAMINPREVKLYAFAKHYPHREEEEKKKEFTRKPIESTIKKTEYIDTKSDYETTKKERAIVKFDDKFYVECPLDELEKHQLIKLANDEYEEVTVV